MRQYVDTGFQRVTDHGFRIDMRVDAETVAIGGLHHFFVVRARHGIGLDHVDAGFGQHVDLRGGLFGCFPDELEFQVRRIVQAGRPIVATIAHRSWIYPATMAFPERLQDPQLKADFGPEIYEEVQRSFKNWHTLPYFQRTDREMFFRERGVKQFIESGAVMGMGTDSGTPMNFNTEALWREIKVHVDMGMSPQRAIAAATRINARIIGRADDLGTIEPGKLADIIVVNGNPLFNITALAHVETVVKDGVVVKGGPGQPAGKVTRQ